MDFLSVRMALCSFCFIFSRTQSTLHESVMGKKETKENKNNGRLKWRIFKGVNQKMRHITPEASSSFISISNSAVMWETSLAGDLRPRRRFFDESHLRLTKVTWQSSVQGNWPPAKVQKSKSEWRRQGVYLKDQNMYHMHLVNFLDYSDL